MQTLRHRSLHGSQFNWQTLLLAVIGVLYFSAISLHQTHASEFSAMQSVAASAQLIDSGNSERAPETLVPQCADQMHCHSMAVLQYGALNEKIDAASAVSSTPAFVRQQFSPFPTPPPKIS